MQNSPKPTLAPASHIGTAFDAFLSDFLGQKTTAVAFLATVEALPHEENSTQVQDMPIPPFTPTGERLGLVGMKYANA